MFYLRTTRKSLYNPFRFLSTSGIGTCGLDKLWKPCLILPLRKICIWGCSKELEELNAECTGTGLDAKGYNLRPAKGIRKLVRHSSREYEVCLMRAKFARPLALVALGVRRLTLRHPAVLFSRGPQCPLTFSRTEPTWRVCGSAF